MCNILPERLYMNWKAVYTDIYYYMYFTHTNCDEK